MNLITCVHSQKRLISYDWSRVWFSYCQYCRRSCQAPAVGHCRYISKVTIIFHFLDWISWQKQRVFVFKHRTRTVPVCHQKLLSRGHRLSPGLWCHKVSGSITISRLPSPSCPTAIMPSSFCHNYISHRETPMIPSTSITAAKSSSCYHHHHHPQRLIIPHSHYTVSSSAARLTTIWRVGLLMQEISRDPTSPLSLWETNAIVAKTAKWRC